MSYLTKYIFILFVYLFAVSSGFCIEYHVAPSGDDLNGDGSVKSPWRTPEFGAKRLTQPGDTLIIHAGRYSLSSGNLPQGHRDLGRWIALVSPPSNISGTESNPITIKSAGDGEVLLDAGEKPAWPAVGTNIGDYLVIDGISVRGSAILWGTTGSVIKNSNLFGGIDTPITNGGDNFGCVVRVENCTDCTIQFNVLHDNQLGITRGNSPLLIEYDSTNLTIENNDIYNSVGAGIFLKDNPETVFIRNNHIYDNHDSGIYGASQDLGHNVFIYNNIIRNNNTSNSMAEGGIKTLVHLRNWKIYNNTFYKNGNSDIRTLYDLELGDIQVWNNIFYNDNSHYYIGYSGTGATFSTTWIYSDYNQFYGASNKWIEKVVTWDKLSAFSAATGFDHNSITTEPNFINPGGFSANDYKRLSYPKNGRGGAYKPVMGAYVNGAELIGFGKKPKKFSVDVN